MIYESRYVEVDKSLFQNYLQVTLKSIYLYSVKRLNQRQVNVGRIGGSLNRADIRLFQQGRHMDMPQMSVTFQ